jgi:hypothetical protein
MIGAPESLATCKVRSEAQFFRRQHSERALAGDVFLTIKPFWLRFEPPDLSP